MDAAREAALRLLSFRERSALELRQRLKQKGFPPDAIAMALSRLAELEVQSDERFAERLAESQVAKGRSGRLIQGELRSRGVPAELAAAAAASSPEEDRARALALAQQRAARLRGLPPETARRRIVGLLARRGHDQETCLSVAAEVTSRENLDPHLGPDVP